MSFITKRERVFNEYDLFDLPPRNEGKLKAYASCTDARAWSHFCSDKSEHLVEIIKRNNETIRPKYLPTNVIVDTLMVAKNAEIARLKRKIEEFEEMLAAYDQLELTCDQKCEIANAHAAIKAANKELDDLCLNLDLSGFTEGIDSEGFETGKSRGDEATPKTTDGEELSPKKETKGVQKDMSCTCEVATIVTDSRIDEMQDTIIAKDAKLNAMKNTIAVMENDVCEPYCIYAHIYTALEKIFGILCQNDKYRQYLKLLTAGKDTRCIDIKGKILFKLKVLEKFCCALIAPCTQDFVSHGTQQNDDCACYRVDLVPRVEPTYALTSMESKQPSLDNKRAQLVADIMKNEEMKEILSRESALNADEVLPDECFVIDNYSIDVENLKRLKSLQENYDDLMTCYESLKHEKDDLEIRCNKYEEIEKEYENLKAQMREYNSLWNEKEHYRKRSVDLDSLKEQYLVLTDETSNLETQLKAESEINHIKSKTMEGLRNENILLEKKLNEATIAFEKEKNALLCKLKEADCRVMCQGQQVKSLALQIDKLLEHDHEQAHTRASENHSIALIDEIESSKDQIRNLRDALICNEEEKQDLQKQYQDHLSVINDLRLEVEDWKSSYEKTLQINDSLEKYRESLIEQNRILSQDVDEKSAAVENLINVINNKSQEINNLMHDIEKKKNENKELRKQFNEMRDRFDNSLVSLESEKLQALQSLQLVRQESQELLERVKDYDQVIHKKDDITKSLEIQLDDNKELQKLLMNTMEENRNLKIDLASRENDNSILLQKIQRLREVNEYAVDNINSLQDEKNQYKLSLELNRKESGELKDKLMHFENLSLQLQNLQESHSKLTEDKKRLESELLEKSFELDSAIHSIQLTKRESNELLTRLQQAEGSKDYELSRVGEAYQQVSIEKHAAQKEVIEKQRDIDNLLQSLDNLKHQNEHLIQKCNDADDLEHEFADLQKAYAELSVEKKILQNDFDNKTEEINNLYNTLETKIEENRELLEQIKCLEINQAKATSSIQALQDDNYSVQARINVMKKESADLVDKIKHYETLETEFDILKKAHDQMKVEKEKLQNELNMQLTDLKRMEQENFELHSHSQNLLAHSEDLENALISARTEFIKTSSFSNDSYKDIMIEIEEMRQEKHFNQNKIRELLDKLDESENIISNLSEDVLARDDRIATLQNHINELEEEVRRLHSSLAEVIDTGEEMKDVSFQRIDSLKTMEAHHSRATHNMKMELAKLQHENSMLSEQLSVTKVKSKESSQDKHKYVSQLTNFQNEREIIVTDIKELEIKTVGDSTLSPSNSDVEDILTSLDRIRTALDARNSKSSSLERTLLKVQTSSQLLLSKADEAKRLVEREKQKIISEKEDAIKDRQNMEKQLLDLKEKLENQISNDKVVIKDLEAAILNQKLMFNNINKSTQVYISKLKDELQTLQELYENSVERIGELQEKLQIMTEDKSNLVDTIEIIKVDLDVKSREISELINELETLKNKPNRSMETQVQLSDIYCNIGSQTDMELLYNGTDTMYNVEGTTSMNETKEKKSGNMDSIQMMEINKPPLDKKHFNPEMQQTPVGLKEALNEVQVLTANVEPTFEIIKSSYVDYKMKQLSPGRLEQHSIACLSDDENENNAAAGTKSLNHPRKRSRSRKSVKKYVNADTQSNNLIDIYNRHSIDTNSSKGNEGSDNIISGKLKSQIKGKSTGYASHETDSNIVGKYRDSKSNGESTSEKSTEKDLFVIYKDSEDSYNNKKGQRKGTWSGKGHSEIVVEAVTVHSVNKAKSNETNHPKNNMGPDSHMFMYQESEENPEDDSVKHKLKINLPRVGMDSASVVTTSDGDKKSLDSYTLAMYSTPKQQFDSDTRLNDNLDGKNIKHGIPSMPTISNYDDQYIGSYNSIAVGSAEDTIKPEIKKTKVINIETDSGTSKQKRSQVSGNKTKISTPYDSESHHKLSRVGADVLLLKAEQEKNASKMRQNFGLEYILDTVQGEIDPDVVKYYTTKELRKTRSDERFNLVKIREKTDSSPSRLSDVKISSTEYKTNSTNSKSSEKSHTKSYAERSIMAKLDINDDYEHKIHSLTRALENIEKDYKKKIDAIKVQYDSNIKSIINEHNQGVKSIQSLHEETLQDIIKLHENEVENLRTMSIEAMRKADKLEKENRVLKTKVPDSGATCLDEEPIKITSTDTKKRRKCRGDTTMLTKTTVEAFNVKPKSRSNGPCTCSLDVNISDTIRNIFEQVDAEQRKMAEHTYMKYIANKILNGNIDGPFKLDGLQALDAQELSFLHLKVCRTWKTKLTKEEALQKRINSLENELMNKQRNAQQHIAELDRKVAEERRRLQEVCEAVCRSTPAGSRGASPDLEARFAPPPAAPPPTNAEKEPCNCNNTQCCSMDVGGRRSAGDLIPDMAGVGLRNRRTRVESNRAVLARLDVEERRERRLYNDEPPTRLRRSHDRQPLRSTKK